MRRIAVILAVSLFVICPETNARQVSRSDFVEDVNILFLKGDYAALVKKTERFVPEHRFGGNQKKEIMYLAGLSCVQLGEFSKARNLFGKILKMCGNAFREEAYIGIADSYFYGKEYDNAIDAYKNVLEIYPDSERASSIYYNTALCYGAKKNTAKADIYFQKVKNQYGESLEAGKIESLRESKKTSYYIVQLGAFGDLKNAKKLLKKLKRKKYDSYIQKVRKKGGPCKRGRAGKFSIKTSEMGFLRGLSRERFAARIIVE